MLLLGFLGSNRGLLLLDKHSLIGPLSLSKHITDCGKCELLGTGCLDCHFLLSILTDLFKTYPENNKTLQKARNPAKIKMKRSRLTLRCEIFSYK